MPVEGTVFFNPQISFRSRRFVAGIANYVRNPNPNPNLMVFRASHSRKGAVQESRGTCYAVKDARAEPLFFHCFMKASCVPDIRCSATEKDGRGAEMGDESEEPWTSPKTRVSSQRYMYYRAARAKAHKYDASITAQRTQRKNDDDLIGTVGYFSSRHVLS